MGKHKEWRKLAKKARRKRIRQTLAKVRQFIKDEEQKQREQSPSYLELVRKQEEDQQFAIEEEARLAAEAEARWLQIEEEAQKQWRALQEKLAKIREERARQNAQIKLEWEREQHRLQQIKDEQEAALRERERVEKELEEKLQSFIENGGSTPEHLKICIETNPNKVVCPFFQKTAACRFRDLCSRNHKKPGVSRILLIPNFYSHYSLEQNENEHGDSSLEFENDETYSHFKEFFFDVFPEMEQYGRIRQFKVCCNHGHHLRGNVYVEYSCTRDAVKGFQVFNGRWYGGRQLSVEFCNIESWKSAICGLFYKQRCPKGNACNFLHVFKNPHNLFEQADRDEHRTPLRSDRNSECDRRNWRWSESPERLPLIEPYTHKQSKHSPTRTKKIRNGSRSRYHRHRSKSPSRKRRRSRSRSVKARRSKR